MAIGELPLNLKNGLQLWLNEQGKDMSGNGNDGTLVNGPTVVRKGKNSKGLSYNGSNQTTTAPSINNPNLSASVWLKANDFSNFVFIFDKYSIGNDTQTSWMIDTYPSNVIRGGILNLSTFSTVSYNNPSVGKWYNAIITYDGVYLKLYINGILVGSNTAVGINSTSTVITVGGVQGGSFYFNGQILNPMLWNRALSPTEIQQLYYSQFIK